MRLLFFCLSCGTEQLHVVTQLLTEAIIHSILNEAKVVAAVQIQFTDFFHACGDKIRVQIDLGDAATAARARFSSPVPEPPANERNIHAFSDLFQTIKVDVRRAGIGAMSSADSDRKAVDAGLLNVIGGLIGVGQVCGCVIRFAFAYVAKLSLHATPTACAIFTNSPTSRTFSS